MCSNLFYYYILKIDSMLPCVCSVIDPRRRQNVVRTSVAHWAIASGATFWFLPHFDVISYLLLKRRTATWNLFVNYFIANLHITETLSILFSTNYDKNNIIRRAKAHSKTGFSVSHRKSRKTLQS